LHDKPMIDYAHDIMRKYFRDIFSHKHLLSAFIKRDLAARYGKSLIGVFWYVLHPLLLILVYTFVFGYLLSVRIGGTGSTTNYGIFLFCGMLPWLMISECIIRSSTVIFEHKELVRQIQFPTVLLPLKVALTALLHQSIATLLYLFVLIGLGSRPQLVNLWIVPALFIQLIMGFGIGMAVSSAYVYVKDVGPMIQALTTLGFFATPVVYPLSLVPAWLRPYFYLNPLTPLVEIYRGALLGLPWPAPAAMAYLIVFSVVALIFGQMVFSRLSRDFSDFI